MASKTNPLSRFRLVFQRSSLVTKCVVLTTLVVTTVALLTLTLGIRSAKAREAASREKAIALEQENKELEDKIDSLDSVDGDKAHAEEYFGLVDPNTVVFTPEN